jgi:hypothetical protein
MALLNYSTESNEKVILNWKECGMKLPWPILFSSIRFERLKPRNASVRTADRRDEIQTPYL